MILTVKLGEKVPDRGLFTNNVAPVEVTSAILMITSAQPPEPETILPTYASGVALKLSAPQLIGKVFVSPAAKLEVTVTEALTFFDCVPSVFLMMPLPFWTVIFVFN